MRCRGLAVVVAMASQAAVLERFEPKLPVAFEENRGQVQSPAPHLAADQGGYLAAEDGRSGELPSMSLHNPAAQDRSEIAGPAGA